MFPIAGWTTPVQLLKEELIQLEYEGFLIPEEIREQVKMIDPDHDAYSDSILRIYKQLERLRKRPDYDWVEPNELEEIRALRPKGVRKLELTLSDADLEKRFHGAWRGRSVGCALGKPVESKRRKPIKEYLEEVLDFGVSHHCIVTLGECAEELKIAAEMLGVQPFCVK